MSNTEISRNNNILETIHLPDFDMVIDDVFRATANSTQACFRHASSPAVARYQEIQATLCLPKDVPTANGNHLEIRIDDYCQTATLYNTDRQYIQQLSVTKPGENSPATKISIPSPDQDSYPPRWIEIRAHTSPSKGQPFISATKFSLGDLGRLVQRGKLNPSLRITPDATGHTRELEITPCQTAEAIRVISTNLYDHERRGIPKPTIKITEDDLTVELPNETEHYEPAYTKDTMEQLTQRKEGYEKGKEREVTAIREMLGLTDLPTGLSVSITGNYKNERVTIRVDKNHPDYAAIVYGVHDLALTQAAIAANNIRPANELFIAIESGDEAKVKKIATALKADRKRQLTVEFEELKAKLADDIVKNGSNDTLAATATVEHAELVATKTQESEHEVSKIMEKAQRQADKILQEATERAEKVEERSLADIANTSTPAERVMRSRHYLEDDRRQKELLLQLLG